MSLLHPELTYFYRCFQCGETWSKAYKGFWKFAHAPDRPQTQCPCCGEWYYPNQQYFEGELTHVHRPRR